MSQMSLVYLHSIMVVEILKLGRIQRPVFSPNFVMN